MGTLKGTHQSFLLGTVAIAQTDGDIDVTPFGWQAVRPDVVRIGDYFYLHVLRTRPVPHGFRLIKLDSNLKSIYEREVYSGNAHPTDARLSVDDKNSLWYSFETTNFNRSPGNYLNLAEYDVTTDPDRPILRKSKAEVVTGFFAQPPNLPPPGSELMDDPAPFFHNGKRHVLTKTFATPKVYIRLLADDLTIRDTYSIDLSNQIDKFFVAPSALIEIKNKVFLIAGITDGPRSDPKCISKIVAIAVTDDLKQVKGKAYPLTSADEFASYVSSVKFRDDKLYLLHNVFTGRVDIGTGQQEHVGMLRIYNADSFALLKSITINKGIMLDNHLTMEFMGDSLYVFYNTPEQRVMVRRLKLSEL